MNIRVISGEFGNRKLKAPDGDITHPMGERIRNALFNILGASTKDARVLDVFAGSGSLGIEALSRGAKSAVFIERDRTAQRAIQDNIGTLKLEDRAKLVPTSVTAWLDGSKGQEFDLILVDPPYSDMQLSTVERLMGHLKPGALMVLSTPDRSEVLAKAGVVVVDNRSYGNANLTFYRRV